jgi:nucleotide-binding universal stress UspA family protein
MVPLDGPTISRQALPCAIDLAKRCHADVDLLQAIPPTIDAYPYIQLPASVRELLRMQALHELREVADDLRRHGLTATPLVVEGYAAEVIVETAAQRHVDLIVMVTHGYSGIKRWALGSVADKVAHAAMAPLVLIRLGPNEDERDTLESEE